MDVAAGVPAIWAEQITPDVAAHVLWHFGPLNDGALEPGSFTVRLLAAIAAADHQNRGRLSLGFPGYTLAFSLAQDSDGGIELLSKIARSR
jgi:hypothetical protein